jgi:prepilin-type N-terminal cleavage/methylation domain-containing protein
MPCTVSDSHIHRSPKSHRAFTLVELLVVIGLIAALGTIFALGLKGGGRSVELSSAQSLLANLVNTVRLKAVTTGHETRLLLNTDPVSDPRSARFLRYLVWQERVADEWHTLGEAWLPEGVGLLPRDPRSPANLLASNGVWTRADGTTLRSTALQAADDLHLAVNSNVTESWASLSFTAAGTTFSNGDLVLATLEPLPPGSYASGESPFQFTNPENVRGLSLSRYGLASLVSGRMGF